MSQRSDARWRRRLSLLIAVIAIPISYLTLAVAAPAQAAGTAHYVDCSQSSNGNGTQSSPWNNLSSVNATGYGPGDQILFARSATCTGALHPSGSGNSSATITVDAYGIGAQPVINDGGADDAAVLLSDQSYWDIQNLEIVGGVHYGVHVTGSTANAMLTHVHLTNLNVHGATSTSTRRGDSGEVYIYPNASGESISDVVVNGVNAHDSHVSQGIYIAGEYGAFPAGTQVASPPAGPIGSGPVGATGNNVSVLNSTAHNVYGDGILLTQVSHGLVQNSVSYESGECPSCGSTPSGIWEWYCQACTLQYNESYSNHSWASYDGGAFDIDNFNASNVVQYNYGHDNDGYCVAVYSGSNYNEPNNVFRYNVCANNVRRPGDVSGSVELSTDSGSSINALQVYNNTFFSNPAASTAVFDQTKTTTAQFGVFKNNLVYATNDKMVNGSGTLTFDNNLYYTATGDSPTFSVGGTTYNGLPAFQSGTGQDTHSTTANPNLNLAGGHGPGMPALAYTLAPGSPALGAGTNVCAGVSGCDMGSRDFYGNTTTTTGSHNIGAYDRPNGVNVIADAGFESGDCTGWNCYSGAAAVSGNAHSGSWAVQLPPNAGAEQTITNLAPNSTYTLTGWAKSGTAGQCLYIGVKNFGGTETRSCQNSAAYSSSTVTFTTGATNTSATIYLWNPPGNTAAGLGDDLTLTAATGQLMLSASFTCLDVPNSSAANGTRLDIWSCNRGANQTYTHTDANTLQVYGGNSLRCVDDLNSATTSGSPVGIWSCGGQANQQWNLNPDGTITTPAAPGLCLGVPDGQSADGTQVSLLTCNGGSYQRWAVR